MTAIDTKSQLPTLDPPATGGDAADPDVAMARRDGLQRTVFRQPRNIRVDRHIDGACGGAALSPLIAPDAMLALEGNQHIA